MRIKMRYFLVLALIFFIWAGCQQKPATIAENKELRWVTESVEYIGLCKQTYALAWQKLQPQLSALKEPWTVVLDIDETVLSNAQYEIELRDKGEKFNPDSWTAWVERREATAIPGVKQFLDNIRAVGPNAYVVFITNRDVHHQQATIDNLKAQGLWQERDVILCRRSKSDSKTQRRTEVATASGRCADLPQKRIIALFGDNLKDFYEVDAAAGLEKILHAGLQDSRWGSEFFVLPNPIYGSWEKAYK